MLLYMSSRVLLFVFAIVLRLDFSVSGNEFFPRIWFDQKQIESITSLV